MVATLSVKLVDDVPSWIAALATFGTLVAAIVALIFAYKAGVAANRALDDAKQTRHGQLVVETLRDWSTREAEEAHALHGQLTEENLIALTDRLFETPSGRPSHKGLEEDLKSWSTLVRVANLIEALGILVSEGALTSEVVYKMWGGPILEAWPKWDEAVKRLRRYIKEPDQFIYFEKIALEMQEINAARKNLAATTSASRDPQAAAEADLETSESSLPPQSAVPKSNKSLTRNLTTGFVAVVAVSTLVRWACRSPNE
jgi:hypothetical protein